MHSLIVSKTLLDATSSRLRGLLRTLVDSHGPAAASYEDFERTLAQVPVELGVVVLSPDPERGLEILDRLRRQISGYVLAVGPASDPRLILRTLHGGADHFLDEAELEACLEAILPRLKPREESTPVGRVTAILGASGGCGVSTLAANMATVLARETAKCALIDLNPGKGDLAALLDLKPAFTLADLCLNIGRLDRAIFEKMLAVHGSGVSLLGAPQVFAECRVVTVQGVVQALSMARKLFPHVVVDLEDCFHEEQLVVLREANTIVLVSRLDFTSLRKARQILTHLGDLDISRSRVRVVINRSGQPNELPVADAEDALGEKLAHLVPDDPRTLNQANNLGQPAVLQYPNAKVSQSIVQLTKLLCERRRPEAIHATNGTKR